MYIWQLLRDTLLPARIDDRKGECYKYARIHEEFKLDMGS